MKQQTIIWLSIIIIVVAGVYWLQSSKTSTKNQVVITKEQAPIAKEESATFTELTSEELSTMLAKKDFTLIDVHVPEQVHIPGTDYMIPYNNIDAFISTLPEKNAKIVLYCRSGGMSKRTAKALAEKGYTNVFNLTDGMNSWSAEGRDTVAKGTIPTAPAI